jgi:hypothetical protein
MAAKQAKRKKRVLTGTADVDGLGLSWELISEPGWTSDGFRGARVEISLTRAAGRPLIVQFPYDPAAAHPQRPKIPPTIVEAAAREAMTDGWDPESRGRPYHFSTEAKLEAG